ncbi:MAG: spermidine synthase [Sandaracinaceae bacterium]
MARPWKLLESVKTDEGALDLRQRGPRDFMISVGGRVLMTSQHNRSEKSLATLGCAPLKANPAPRVLIGGLGLGYTLRAALDVLPKKAKVVVAELTPQVVTWCRGPLAVLSDDSLADPRVEVVVGDVADRIRDVSGDAQRARWDAILLDLYIGPGVDKKAASDPLYGNNILRHVKKSLAPRGVFAVWGEDPAPPFEARVRRAGFDVQRHVVSGGGPRHVIVVGRATKG